MIFRFMSLLLAVLISFFPVLPWISPGLTQPKGAAVALEEDFQKVAQTTGPAVVNISSERVVARTYGWPYDDPFFRQFMGVPPGYEREQSLGSGFIISQDGTILTNQHVVAGAQKITVKISEGLELSARLMGEDKKTDLAVLKVTAKQSLPTVILGDSDKVRVGQWAIAIGNPFVGLERTLTVGVISATGRKIQARGGRSYTDFIQTDASINPGNSGGPLCNLKGEVVGINTAIYSTSGGSIGIGFAIPINTAKKALSEITKNNRSGHSGQAESQTSLQYRGMTIQPLTQETSVQLGFAPDSRALVVTDVAEESVAVEAGIQPGDILLEVNKVRVQTLAQLKPLLVKTGEASNVLVLVQRGRQGYYVVLSGTE